MSEFASLSPAVAAELGRLTRTHLGRIFRRHTGPGRVERREAVSNKLLELVHQAATSCVSSGLFPAKDPLHHDGDTYAFWFWTINGHLLEPDPTILNPYLPPSGLDCVTRAVQWYYKTGPTGGSPTVYLWAFDTEAGVFSPESPVEAPPEAEGQNQVPTQDQGWTITARPAIGSGNQTRPFHRWWRTGSPPQADFDPTLEVAEGSTGAAIAFYGSVQIPDPGFDDDDHIRKQTPDLSDILLQVDSLVLSRLVRRIARLEHEVALGRSFIRADERPPVDRDPPGPPRR